MGKAQFWMQIVLAIVFVLVAIVETAIGNTPWGAVFGALAILTAVVTVFRFKKDRGAATQ